MSTFEFFYELIKNHGGVAYYHKQEAENVWNGLSLNEQREVYQRVKKKLQERKFVNYNPAQAIRENTPLATKQTLTYDQYYKQFGTTEDRDGWQRVFDKDKRQTFYIKQ